MALGEKGTQEWRDALDLFFCSDADLIAYVQQIVGLAAVGKVYFEALIIAYGEGSNGKSTFWNTISRVLGSYSGSISADALTVGCKRNVNPEMAELKGKRLIIAAELEEGMRVSGVPAVSDGCQPKISHKL
jgi:putative DNA primase/helicase